MRTRVLSIVILLVSISTSGALAGNVPVTVSDATLTSPLANPAPASYQPRYISGFGSDDSFTVFFEDRDNAGTIAFVQTTTGPTGFPGSVTLTDITGETHFTVKDWPITLSGGACDGNWDYRGWGSVGNNLDHRFYVSDNLANWCLVSTFQIPNAAAFTSARGQVYYGFHDVTLLNGTYYAWGESNQSQTMMVRSTLGDDVWEAFDTVGGAQAGDLPLQVVPGPTGATPTGSFFDLGADRGYGMLMTPYDDSAWYLAVNTTAKPSLAPAALEAAFIDPNNWTWNDDTTGPATTAILSATAEHDLRECWVVPTSGGGTSWTVMYDADFGGGDGGKALGYTGLSAPPPTPVPTLSPWSKAALGLFLLACLALVLSGLKRRVS